MRKDVPIILEPQYTVGVMTVYKRKPKPMGCQPYVVGHAITGRLLEDFGRIDSARKWAKANQEG